jgi:hypothetical protein
VPIGYGDLDRRIHVEQPHRVGDGRPGPADASGDLLLGHLELVGELAVGTRLLHRVEIRPLDVLDQGKLELVPVRELANDGGDPLEPGQERCSIDARGDGW